VVEEGRRPGDPACLIAQAEKIKQLTDWRPRFDSCKPLLKMPGAGRVSWPESNPWIWLISHLNADFDCLGSLAAAARLYPGALLSFPGSQEKNLRDFCSRHPDLLPSACPFQRCRSSLITRLIIVDCQHSSRIARFAELLERPT
jgi:hypothetical protein